MIVDLIMLIAGGLGVWLGAEGLVRGAVKIAEHFGVSSLVVGLTVVAFGTSAPELVVSSMAAVRGHSEIALGNVIGSNIVNIGAILGLSALLSPFVVSRVILRRDMPMLLVVTLLVLGLCFHENRLSRIDGLALLIAFSIYMMFNFRLAFEENRRSTMVDGWVRPALTTKDLLILTGGLILLVAGADGMVRGAVGFATALGVSKKVIGMTIVAIGTSLPELAASVVAARHGEADLAVGNVVGSNMFNALLILGTASLIAPISDTGWVNVHNMVFFLGFVLLLFPLMFFGARFGRIKGVLLLALYAMSVLTALNF